MGDPVCSWLMATHVYIGEGFVITNFLQHIKFGITRLAYSLVHVGGPGQSHYNEG